MSPSWGPPLSYTVTPGRRPPQLLRLRVSCTRASLAAAAPGWRGSAEGVPGGQGPGRGQRPPGAWEGARKEGRHQQLPHPRRRLGSGPAERG